MSIRKLATYAVAALLSVTSIASAQSTATGALAIDNDDIGGAVVSSRGPEAGVWVIAETESLPTKFRKIVVTDDSGRYVLPDLPPATYALWVRGYGLVDSPRVTVTPGVHVDLPAVTRGPTPPATRSPATTHNPQSSSAYFIGCTPYHWTTGSATFIVALDPSLQAVRRSAEQAHVHDDHLSGIGLAGERRRRLQPMQQRPVDRMNNGRGRVRLDVRMR